MSEDKIIKKLLEHDEKLANVVEKDEFQQFRSEMLKGQDKMVAILKRLDDERVFTQKWVEEMEGRIDKNEKELKKLKLQLKVA